MPDPLGFVRLRRLAPLGRPIGERVADYKELHTHPSTEAIQQQARRCMGCGIPFCHNGCPLHNLIPDWNALVERESWEQALSKLHRTNNFPEFTGRLCPAPCETSCVLAVNDQPVAIKEIERSIIDRGFSEGWVRPQPAAVKTGRRVAVIGSGPAGLAAAQQLARGGHAVTVFETADRPGGLLRYGIPDYKLPRTMLDRRLTQLEAEGVEFRCNTTAGRTVLGPELMDDYSAVCLAVGATRPRDLDIPGRELDGVHFALDYLKQQNRRVGGLAPISDTPVISAAARRVMILGGGDTGADCLGNALREGCLEVTQLELLPEPPPTRADDNPWPEWPLIMRTSTAHEEGGQRLFGVQTVRFHERSGRVAELELQGIRMTGAGTGRTLEPVPDSTEVRPADLVLLALGFTGPSPDDILSDLNLSLDQRGRVATRPGGATSRVGVFACGDAVLGASLVVSAIASGRACAATIDSWLSANSD
ncbi:MAG TPA: glutamate synthase subunit beta [Candidatus Dormibacteraeota bacterium]|nr:glutamate synthase subunit beta [Candidatus Dormibacteraeota bacterium]